MKVGRFEDIYTWQGWSSKWTVKRNIVIIRCQHGVLKHCHGWTSPVAQWLRIRLPMQGTWVRSLVQEDPTCCGATKPLHHNYQPTCRQLLKPVRLEPVLCNKRSHCREKPTHGDEDSMQPEIKTNQKNTVMVNSPHVTFWEKRWITVNPLYLWVLHPRIEDIQRKKNSIKFQKSKLESAIH